MEYLKAGLNNIINHFFQNEQIEHNTTTTTDSTKDVNYIEYKDFMIDDNSDIKQIIDRFNNICDSVPNKSIEYFNLPNLTLTESIYSLDILISRPDIMDFLAKNKNDYTEEVVGVICKLYLNIYKLYNIKIDDEKNIINKAQLNFDLCEIIIKYTFVFTHPAFSKFFFDLWKYNIKKYYLLAKNEGCLISWITFSILAPVLVNDKCYPIINTNSRIFKNINWKYIKEKTYFEKRFNMFIKYYITPFSY